MVFLKYRKVLVILDKAQLELVKKEIDELLDGIYDTKDKLTIAKTKFEEGVVINGKALDDGKIEKDLYKLDQVIQNLLNVREHCNQKISSNEKK